jgi:ABC-type multidrug transport system ATPase subunit
MAQTRATSPASVAPELDRRARVLSKGQLQRLALADALAGHAWLLILDEPWTGLDARAGPDTT